MPEAHLTEKDIKKHLGDGKYVFVPIPKNVTDEKVGQEWLNQMSQFREKASGVISFAGDKTTFEELFGGEPLAPSQMTKKFWDYVNP